MSKVLILAEKPKQAQAYADAFRNTSRREGFIEVGPNEWFSEGAYITWAIGHLVELVKPGDYKEEWKYWDLKSLPIKPERFIFQPKESTKKQLMIIQELLTKTNDVIIATDIDREGDNVAWAILNYLKATDKSIKRLWINSLDEDVVRNGFSNLQDATKSHQWHVEAQTRQISDWIVGMNASQLYTLLLKDKGVNRAFSLGRVQTPTLYMINQREQEIANFVPKPFFEIKAIVNHQNGEFTVSTDGKYETLQEADDVLSKYLLKSKIDYGATITSIDRKEEVVHSPKLYTLSSIQTKANKEWKYSPADTLKIAQSLYERKLLTYPRTDTPFITEKEYQYVRESVQNYQNVLGIEVPIDSLEPKKRYVDNGKVQEHFAIIPTKSIPDTSVIEKLTEGERTIYLEVVRNTLAMFMAPNRFEKTTVSIDLKGLSFATTGKVELESGWKCLYPKEDENKKKENVLPKMNELDEVRCSPFIKEGKTSKPKRYSEGDLIQLMKTAGKHLDEEEQAVLKETEGIGTEATRAGVLETLKHKEYINVVKNLVYMTKRGELLCQVVEGTLLSSPSMTAKWEQFLKLIGQGEKNQASFLKGIYHFIDQLLVEAPKEIEKPGLAIILDEHKTEDSLGLCPACQKGLFQERKNFYGCSRYAEGCKQTLPKVLLKKNISSTQIKQLLSKGKTSLIKGFSGKKPFDAYLALEASGEADLKKIQFLFKKG